MAIPIRHANSGRVIAGARTFFVTSSVIGKDIPAPAPTRKEFGCPDRSQPPGEFGKFHMEEEHMKRLSVWNWFFRVTLVAMLLLVCVSSALAQGTWAEKSPPASPVQSLAVINGTIYGIG